MLACVLIREEGEKEKKKRKKKVGWAREVGRMK
jgi:hypothetical protein